MVYTYERPIRKNVLSEELQLTTMSLLSRVFRSTLHQYSPSNLIALLVDKSWAHHIPTSTSDVDILYLSRGSVQRDEVIEFTEILSRALISAKLEHNLYNGLRNIDADIDTVPIDTIKGKKRLIAFHKYNKRVPFILITNDELLSAEIANLRIQTVQF